MSNTRSLHHDPSVREARVRRDVLARVLSPPRALVVRRRAPVRVDDGEVDGDVAPGRVHRSRRSSADDRTRRRRRADARPRARGASRVARARRASRRGATTSTGAKRHFGTKGKKSRMGKQYVASATLREIPKRLERFGRRDGVDATRRAHRGSVSRGRRGVASREASSSSHGERRRRRSSPPAPARSRASCSTGKSA